MTTLAERAKKLGLHDANLYKIFDRVEQLEAQVDELRNALDDCHKARSVLRDAMVVTPAKWGDDSKENL